MQIVVDTRPSAELSDAEVVMHLFQAARAEQLASKDALDQACHRMFPDLPEARRLRCYGQLFRACDGPEEVATRGRGRIRH